MIISTKHKFVYCAVPKVASRALRGLLEPLMDEELHGKVFSATRNHRGMVAFRKPQKVRKKLVKAGYDPDEFYWFGFMRNPWDRAVSRYKFEHKRATIPDAVNKISSEAAKYHRFMIGMEWEEYLERGLYTPQIEWLRDEDRIVVDRVYRMEDMADALAELSDRIGHTLSVPPVRGATDRKRDYRVYYENDRQILNVARFYAEDVLLGGYRYDGESGEAYDLSRVIANPSR